METNKLVAGIVAAAIAVIVLAGVLMPALSNATDTHDDFTNAGLFFVEGLAEDESVTYSCDGTGAYVDGVQITGEYATGYSGGASIAYTENFIIRWAGTGNFALRGAYFAYDATGPASVTFNGDGTYSGSYTTSGVAATFTGTFTEFYGLVLDKTNRVMSGPTDHKYVNGDSNINGTGLTNCTNIGSYLVFNIEGSIDDNVTITAYNQTNGAAITGLTYSNVTINKTEVSGYLDLYDITSITFDVTDSNNKTDSVTYTVFTIPTTVTAEKAQHLSDAQIVILDVIPLLIIVAVLLGVVAVFILRRE